MIDLPKTPSLRLDGLRALVTGASSGIGLGCAVALAEAGADVVLASRNIKALNEAAEAIIMKGFSAETLQLDISDLRLNRYCFKRSKAF
jgi:NAD(P)-dependent dehydrogenase (short-subunit alcohol dehydrogenase family)